MNKIQQTAQKVGITKQQQLRAALVKYGVGELTARNIWRNGATTRKHYGVIVALEKILLTPAVEFLEDPERLLPRKQ
jgi:hypothetical protein